MATSPLAPGVTRLPAGERVLAAMSRWNVRQLRILLSAGLVALAGCLDDPSPTDPSSTNPGVEPSAGRVPLDPPVVRGHEAPFYEISREVEGFGGYRYDDEALRVTFPRASALDGV